MKKKKLIVFSLILAVVGVLCIAGGTYAMFNYYKKGTIENTVTTGKITFRYDETSVRGIDLQNAIPILDKTGVSMGGQYFDFSVSTQGTDNPLYYAVEVEVTDDSTLDPSVVKVYLTEIVNGKEEVISDSVKDGAIITYDKLDDNTDGTAKVIDYDYFLKTNEEVERNYRLRIWIDKDADFSPLKNEDGTYQEDENGNYIYPYNNQSFKVRVNVRSSMSHIGDSGMGDAYIPCEESICPNESGVTITLPDNSSWSLLTDYNAGDETINLIYSGLIDEEGNYVSNDSLINGYVTSSVIDSALEKFSNKLKENLSDSNIVVSLPTTQILGFDFMNFDYSEYKYDNYYLYDTEPYFYYNGNYAILNSYQNNYDRYWVIDNYIVKQGYDSGSYGIKPVITVSKDYLEPFFAQSYTGVFVTVNHTSYKLSKTEITNITLPAGTEHVNFNSSYYGDPSITAEKVDSFAYTNESNVKRLTTSVAYPVSVGYNYYKVTAVSENGKYTTEYKVSLYVPEN